MSTKRNIAFLLGGTGVAQVFTFAVSPILTRLYTPKDFGVLGVVLAASSIIAVVAHFRLNLAIALAASLEQAKVILKSSITITFFVCFLLSFGTYIYGQIVGDQHYTILITCLIFIFSLLNSNIDLLNYWQSYRNRHKESARNSVIRSLNTGIFQMLLSGFTSLGLVFGAIIGASASIFMYIREIYKVGENEIIAPINFKVIKETVREYKTFPLYSMPQGFLASASQNAVPIILSSGFGVAVAGQYWLAYRILAAPVALLGGAYRQVLHPIISSPSISFQVKVGIARKHTLYFLIFIIPIIILIFLFSQSIFLVIFGKNWGQAGIFASWLAFSFCLDIAKVPSVCLIHSLKLHKSFLIYESMLGVFRVLALFFGLYYKDPVVAVILFTMVSLVFVFVLMYLALFRWSSGAN